MRKCAFSSFGDGQRFRWTQLRTLDMRAASVLGIRIEGHLEPRWSEWFEGAGCKRSPGRWSTSWACNPGLC